jgi:hypothetical protein
VHRKSRLCAAGRPTRNRSGGRQPAVVRITHGVQEELRNVRQLSPPQSRAAGVSPPWHGNALAEGSVFCELSRWGSTVGLRRPLLVHGVRSPEKRRFCDMRTHIHKSGGRQPAVVRITHGVREELRNVRQLSPPQSRAAGVSPPWFANRAGKCKTPDFCTRTSPSDSFPRGADAPRSYFANMRLCTVKVAFALPGDRHATGAAGVSPPWFGLRTVCKKNCVMFSKCRRHSQERRASARRGSVTHLQMQAFFVN